MQFRYISCKPWQCLTYILVRYVQMDDNVIAEVENVLMDKDCMQCGI